MTRWRVRLPARRIVRGEAAGVFLIEIDPGGGFRPATVVEVDSALRQRELFGAADGGAGERSTVEHGERSTGGAAVGAVEHGAAVPPARKRAARAGWNLPPFGDDGRPVRPANRDAEIRRRREAGETVRGIAAALGCGVGTVARALRGPER